MVSRRGLVTIGNLKHVKNRKNFFQTFAKNFGCETKNLAGTPPPPSCLSAAKYEQMLFCTDPLVEIKKKGNGTIK